MKATGTRPKIIVSADDRGVVGHAGARLLADLADATGLTVAFADALAGLRVRESGHNQGRVAVDLAVQLADGGATNSDLAVLRNEPGLFGPVASDPTAWRVLSNVDEAGLARLRDARVQARELAWAQASQTRTGLPASTAAGSLLELRTLADGQQRISTSVTATCWSTGLRRGTLPASPSTALGGRAGCAEVARRAFVTACGSPALLRRGEPAAQILG